MKKQLHNLLYSLPVLVVLLNMQQAAAQNLPSRVVQPVARAVVNFRELAEQERLLPRSVFVMQAPAPNEGDEENMEDNSAPISPYQPSPLNNGIQVPSPAQVLDYQGAPDEAQGGGGGGTFNIPPDTYGATGLDKVFVTVNNNYKILNKTTGAQISLVSMPSFWSALGTNGAGAFDPRVVYDPYKNRWLHAAVSNGGAATSRILLAISRTHDPSGTYDLYAFDHDPGVTSWADFPMLGFNRNWVAISVNLFTVGTNGNAGTAIFAVDYPALLTGTATATQITPAAGFCHYPVETYSNSESVLYVPSHASSGGATYRLSTITGTPSAPVWTLGATLTRAGGGWVQPSGNIGPQTCTVSCPGVLTLLDVGDAFIRGNAVYRNGEIWYAQSVGLPTPTLSRVAVQWTRLNTSGTVLDGGRIEDPAATSSNGGRWYTYPSLSVNKDNAMMAGFTKLESDGFAGAAYAMRYSSDAAGTTQDPVVFKDGEDYYDKASSGRTRWGDYSHVVIDPLEDISFWTWQEYARPRAAPTVFGTTAKWGTWVAKVTPNPCSPSVASGGWNNAANWVCGNVPTATNNVNIMSGQTITLNTNPTAASITVNEGGTLVINGARTLTCKLIVYGTLSFSAGSLTLGNNDLFLSRNATLTGTGPTGSMIITNGTGKMTKMIGPGSSFEFPVSANGLTYTGLVVALGASDPEEVISVRVNTGVTPTAGNNDPSFVQRTWNIEEMTTGSNNATLTFKWTAAEHGSNFTGTAANAFRNDGILWGFVSAMTAPSLSGSVFSSSTTTPITSFSPWAVASASTFPVKFEYFTGNKQGNDHVLNWKLNCDPTTSNFTVERSADGSNFTALGNVALTNDCRLPFSFTDVAPLPKRNYYRIRVNDNNGSFTYSKIVLLLNQTDGLEITSIFPNPATTQTTLSITAARKGTVDVQVTDAQGKLVIELKPELASGINSVKLNTSTLAAGTYFVKVITETGSEQALKFVKE